MTLLLALITLTLVFGMEHYKPNLPAPLFAVVLGIAASWLFGLGQAGVELAGEIPRRLPAPVLPDFSLVNNLWPGALGIALMSFIDSIAAGRAFTRQGEPRTSSNRELVALDVVQRSSLHHILGEDRMFFNVEQAVETYLGKSDEKNVVTETRGEGDIEVSG